MFKIGIAGVGFMGWIHYLAYQRIRGARVTALCEQNRKRLTGDWRDIQGNFGPRGETVDVSKMARYEDFDQFCTDPSIDIVDICLPPSAHAAAAVKALEHGKHVFCEKPMALTTADCQRMVQAAEKANRLIMIGHVLPMFAEYQHARKLIAGGRYGTLIGGNFKRVISDPLWLKDFYDPKLVGGPMLDLHVHDAHLIRLLYGMPTAVMSQGRMRGEVVEYFNTMFQFTDPRLVVTATSGVINQQGRAFLHGFEIHLEKATLVYEFGVIGGEATPLMPLTVFDSQGKVHRPNLGVNDEISPFVAEIKEVLQAVRAGSPSPILGGDLARDAIVLGHKQTESVRKGRRVAI
ncbi:MAG: Gfo/Idh/MocA family oxidoreductase [Planctomycetes bacterium]|nr:Gfo/Idh/MocA family oxidoreductase [Planctomycetota bacterium]